MSGQVPTMVNPRYGQAYSGDVSLPPRKQESSSNYGNKFAINSNNAVINPRYGGPSAPAGPVSLPPRRNKGGKKKSRKAKKSRKPRKSHKARKSHKVNKKSRKHKSRKGGKNNCRH